jgi:uncharacterized protein
MSAKPWIVPIVTLRRAPGTRREEHRVGSVGELVVAASVVPAGAPVTVDAMLEWVGEGVEVAGEVQAAWIGECRRCLRRLEGELRCDVRELYRPGGGSGNDEDTYPLDGDQLDLAPLVRDALLLELPIAPLCRDDCPGLCPTCGAELAAGPCDCPPPLGDERWSVLDALRTTSPGPEPRQP